MHSRTDLVKFLAPYRRVPNDAVCSARLKPDQLTLWVYAQGSWVRKNFTRIESGSGSWCGLYLGSALGADGYKQMKADLFGNARGLNGVYRHNSKNCYAIVYKPVPKLGAKHVAAVAGTVALAGLAGATYWRHAPKEASGSHSTSSTINEQSSTSATADAHSKRMAELNSKYIEIMEEGKDTALTRQSFPDFDEFMRDRDVANKSYDTTVSKVLSACNLGDLGMTYNVVINSLDQSKKFAELGTFRASFDLSMDLFDQAIQDRYIAWRLFSLIRNPGGRQQHIAELINKMEKCEKLGECQYAKAFDELFRLSYKELHKQLVDAMQASKLHDDVKTMYAK